ncbi:hypothetical protein AB0346_11600 [Nocardia beijingensis]|uniref:hypothetical protein n=1 Tax=Nocardia beijingensis TaxID=95162 RepID=UPI0018963CCE|nr:hypothetical protein [Nocardia beijingensis]MBF6077430.1 hypothetical protein [Nocardia beijingensis]
MNGTGTVIIEATGVTYYSPHDEAVFFGWLDAIPCIESYHGQSRTLYLTVDLDAVDEGGLYEIVALYRRYHIDLKELQVLSADRVGPWFSHPDRWWHEEVFG